MPTIGSAPAINNWLWDGAEHQAWNDANYSAANISGPATGHMTNINAIFANLTSTANGSPVGWLNIGSAYYQLRSVAGKAAGSGAPGTNYGASIDVPFLNTDNWKFGFYAASGVYTAYHTDGGTSYVKGSAITPANSPSNNYSAYATGGGTQYGYGTYYLNQVWVKRSGTWQSVFVYVKRSGSWSGPVHVYVKRSGTWTQVAELVRRKELPREKEIKCMVVWPDNEFEEGLIVTDYSDPHYLGIGYPGWKPSIVLPEWVARLKPNLVTV